MRISFDHFIYCIVLYKCKTIFSICCSIFSIICTVLGNVFKRSLITSVIGREDIHIENTSCHVFIDNVTPKDSYFEV